MSLRDQGAPAKSTWSVLPKAGRTDEGEMGVREQGGGVRRKGDRKEKMKAGLRAC